MTLINSFCNLSELSDSCHVVRSDTSRDDLVKVRLVNHEEL